MGRLKVSGCVHSEGTCAECRRERQRSYGLKHRRGITPKEFQERLALQGGKCANISCQRVLEVEADRRRGLNGACVDHDHITEAIRGILCGGCNRALGMVEESIERLEGLISHLKASSALK